MDEILANAERIREILKSRALNQMSPEEFREQKRSFVIGNAFDVFADSDTINQHTMDASELGRLAVVS